MKVSGKRFTPLARSYGRGAGGEGHSRDQRTNSDSFDHR